MRGESNLEAPLIGGVLGCEVGSFRGVGLRCEPSTSVGQLPGVMKGSSVAGILLRWPGGVGWSSSVATDEGCVDTEGECCIVVAVAELVACDLEEGKEVRTVLFCLVLFGTLCLLGPAALPGDDRFPGEDGEDCLPGVTCITVKASSLLPLLDPG